MVELKKDRLDELTKLGFVKHKNFYIKELKVSEINVCACDGTFFFYIRKLVFEDFVSEITHISNVLLSDRHEVDIMLDILREKGMLKDE